jgi:phenylalanine ammonia-lyase
MTKRKDGRGAAARDSNSSANPVELGCHGLTIEDVVRVGRGGAAISLPEGDPEFRRRLDASVNCIQRAVDERKTVYGVNTGFGGMSGVQIDPDHAVALQHNLLWFLKAGAGNPLPQADIRGAMLLRANSFLSGASAVRWEILERIREFLNRGVTPVVREFGAIGASGDLVPLANIAGALIGLGDGFRVDYDGDQREAIDVLAELGLARIHLHPKEGLALVNGTSVSTAMAAICLSDARLLFACSLGAHALMIQGLQGMEESFEPFIHAVKPHPGQVWVARCLRELLSHSKLTSKVQSGVYQQAAEGESVLRRLGRNADAKELLGQLAQELGNNHGKGVSQKGAQLLEKLVKSVRGEQAREVYDVEPIQDRYSIRCLPQYLGPIKDGLTSIGRQIEIEMNSANDNPLVDGETCRIFHGGNFLGQYISIGMDQLRFYLGLLAKHLDAQISLLVAPEFSDGLPPSLVGNTSRSVNMGLKGLQIAGNSIMPILAFLGNSIADRYPTHAEQFNQNISSQSFAAANLARQSVETFRQYIAICLMFGTQAVDLRTRLVSNDQTCDARDYLSPATRPLYEAVRSVVGTPPRRERPYIHNDDEQCLEQHLARLAADVSLGEDGKIAAALGGMVQSIRTT